MDSIDGLGASLTGKDAAASGLQTFDQGAQAFRSASGNQVPVADSENLGIERCKRCSEARCFVGLRVNTGQPGAKTG